VNRIVSRRRAQQQQPMAIALPLPAPLSCSTDLRTLPTAFLVVQ
jgi:hypothetical protein